jgi:hypothetical protein
MALPRVKESHGKEIDSDASGGKRVIWGLEFGIGCLE